MAEIKTLFVKIASEFDARGYNNARDALNGLGKTAGIIGGALVAVAGLAVKAAADQETAQIALAQAMKTAGIFTKEAYDENLKYAASLQNITAYGDEAILGVQRMLIAFGLSGDTLKETTMSVLDLATGLQMDLQSAANLVAKSIGSDTNALARYKIEIQGAAGSTARAESAVRSISKLFGGAAQAQALTFAGQVSQLKNKFSDVTETLGSVLIPVVSKVVSKLADDLVPVLNDMATSLANDRDFALQLEQSIRFIIGALIALKALPDLITSGMATGLAAVTENASLLSAALGPLGPLFDIITMSSRKAMATAGDTSAAKIGWDELKQKIVDYGTTIDRVMKTSTKDVKTAAQRQEDILAALVAVDLAKKAENTNVTREMMLAWMEEKKMYDLDYEVFQDTLRAENLKKTLEAAVVKLEKAKEFVDQASSLAQTYTDFQSQKIDNQLTKDTEAETLRYENRKAWINANIKDETRRNTMLDQLEKGHAATITNLKSQAEAEEKKLQNKMKAFKIAEAIANTAVGVTKAISQGGIFGAAMGAIVAAQGAIQIAMIRAQKFAAGAMVNGPTPAIFGEGGPEIALPLTHPNTTNALAEALGKAGANGGGNNIVVNVNRPLTSLAEARRQGRILGKEIFNEIRRNRKIE